MACAPRPRVETRVTKCSSPWARSKKRSTPCIGILGKIRMASATASVRDAAAAAASDRLRTLPARPRAITARQVVEDFDDNAEAIDILKMSGPVGIFFLLAYILIDSRGHLAPGSLPVSPFHCIPF